MMKYPKTILELIDRLPKILATKEGKKEDILREAVIIALLSFVPMVGKMDGEQFSEEMDKIHDQALNVAVKTLLSRLIE